jgi:hypothetical protein
MVAGEVRELHSARGRQAPERRQQGSGIELRARISTPERRHPLRVGGRVLPGEEPADGIVGSEADEPGLLRQRSGPPAGGLALGGVVLAAVAGDLVEPVVLLADPKWGHAERHADSSPHRRCRCVDELNAGEERSWSCNIGGSVRYAVKMVRASLMT